MATYPQCICASSTIYESAGYPYYPSGSSHGGIDTVHPDLKAYAPTGGTVVVANVWNGDRNPNSAQSWGNYIVVAIGDGNYWLAGHFASQIHSVGDVLNAGDFIGQQGQTGNVTGTHTHWEYWVGGQSTAYRSDPSAILRIPNSAPATYNVSWDASGAPDPGPDPSPDPGPDPEPGGDFVFGYTGAYFHTTGVVPGSTGYPVYTTPGDTSSEAAFLGVPYTFPVYSNIVEIKGQQWFMVQDDDGTYYYTYIIDGYGYLDQNANVGGKVWPPYWLLFKIAKGGKL